MKELLTCCYVLMEIELRAQHTDRLFTLLHMAEMIDLLCRGGIIETRYSDNQPRDEHGRWTSGGGSFTSGAISGALKPDSDEAQEHANRYYEAVRKMKNDHIRIAHNTDFSEEEVKQVKSFVFLEKHDLGGSKPEYFYPSYEMAQSWQRLIDGKNIQPHDITLLKRELMERNLINQGYTQREAHKKTEEKYNYGDESRGYYAKTDKHKDHR